MAQIEISKIEVLVLKKLVLINHALGETIKSEEQKALTRVLNDITLRADLANTVPAPVKVHSETPRSTS